MPVCYVTNVNIIIQEASLIGGDPNKKQEAMTALQELLQAAQDKSYPQQIILSSYDPLVLRQPRKIMGNTINIHVLDYLDEAEARTFYEESAKSLDVDHNDDRISLTKVY